LAEEDDGPQEFVALARDETTYRQLAALPEQDAFYRRWREHVGAEPTWEDVELEIAIQDEVPHRPR